MSDNNGEIISSLKDKISLIVNNYISLKEENHQLKKDNKNLTEKLKQNKQETSILEEKFNNIKLAKTIANASEDSHDAKLKVNRIVREIDKCIALLNR